jgi:hypothetical protein
MFFFLRTQKKQNRTEFLINIHQINGGDNDILSPPLTRGKVGGILTLFKNVKT